MDNAILHAGIDELMTIKEHVVELDSLHGRNVELLKEEARLDKLIAGKEKDLNEEMEATLKKRKSELVSAYESQLATLNARNKKVKAKKEKDKGVKVTERIATETAELRDRNKELTVEIKTKLKADKTPKICNTTLFYSFFMPKTLLEVLLFILGLLIVFPSPFSASSSIFKEISQSLIALYDSFFIVSSSISALMRLATSEIGMGVSEN